MRSFAHFGCLALTVLFALSLAVHSARADGRQECADTRIALHFQPILSRNAREKLREHDPLTVNQVAERIKDQPGCLLRIDYTAELDGTGSAARNRRLFRHFLVPPAAAGGAGFLRPSLVAPGQGLLEIEHSGLTDLVVPLYPIDPRHSPPIRFTLAFDISGSSPFNPAGKSTKSIAELIDRTVARLAERFSSQDEIEVWGFAEKAVRLKKPSPGGVPGARPEDPREPTYDRFTEQNLRDAVRDAGSGRTSLRDLLGSLLETSQNWHHVVVVITDALFDEPDRVASRDSPSSKTRRGAVTSGVGTSANADERQRNTDWSESISGWLSERSWRSWHLFFVVTDFGATFPRAQVGAPEERARHLRHVLANQPVEVLAQEGYGESADANQGSPALGSLLASAGDYIIERVGRQPRVVLTSRWETHDRLQVVVFNDSPCDFPGSQLEPYLVPADHGEVIGAATAAFSSATEDSGSESLQSGSRVVHGLSSFQWYFARPSPFAEGAYAVYARRGAGGATAYASSFGPPVLKDTVRLEPSHPGEARAELCRALPLFDIPAFMARDQIGLKVMMESILNLGPAEPVVKNLGFNMERIFPLLLDKEGTRIDLQLSHRGTPWYQITAEVEKNDRGPMPLSIGPVGPEILAPETEFPHCDGHCKSRLTIPLQPHFPVDVMTDLRLHLYYHFGGGDRYPVPPEDFALNVGSYWRLDQGVPVLTVNRRYYEADRVNLVFRWLLYFCYLAIVATLMRFLFGRWFPLPRALRGYQGISVPRNWSSASGTRPEGQFFRILEGPNGYRFHNLSRYPISLFSAADENRDIHCFPAEGEDLSASEVLELLRHREGKTECRFVVHKAPEVHILQWQRQDGAGWRPLRSDEPPEDASPDKTFREIWSPEETLARTRRGLPLGLIALFFGVLFWLPVGLLRSCAKLFGIKALSASMWHYSPRFHVTPLPRSIWEAFRDVVYPAFVVTYPALYIWVYSGDSAEWVTQFGLWIVVGTGLVGYTLHHARDTARTYLISAGGFILGAASLPLLYELARAFNEVMG